MSLTPLQAAQQAARVRAAGESGVVALLTLLFMMTIGFLTLFILWGIGYSSVAYTTLYGSAQAAAYAAASEVEYTEFGSSLRQLPFACGPGFDSSVANSSPRCTAGARTSNAAINLLAEQLRGQYGLTFGSTVVPLDESGSNFNGVLAYEVGMPPGSAFAADPNCRGVAQDPNGRSNVRSCWSLDQAVQPDLRLGAGESGVLDTNYVSGVVVNLRANIPFFPGCPTGLLGDLCTRNINIAVAARSGQQQPFQGTNTP